ncbi:DNA (cytosine-5-)-methyltransferase [Microbacterium sp.]|uniref:DNA (cytosine-5-)-methyltransferase n=1 Tax=Microbacterium sp. TaxID=51671 RepID=UPI0031FE615E|nr:DNA (cytosine-5-)-methyltransferase [Microbacterium sp.]
MTAAFRFIDLFAGIGGIRMGLEKAGGECVFSVEIDRFARTTYAANFHECEAHDVRAVRGADIPRYDLLAAGFPCQPFSIAGVSKKLSLGRLHGFQDEKSGNLFFEITRLIEEAPEPPSVLFLENVKNLVSHDGGKTFRVIMAALDTLGYNATHRVIDARRWVPQHRERTFIIALHRDVFGEERFEFPDPPSLPQRRVGDVLEANPDGKYTLSQHLWDYLRAYAAKHQAAGNGFGYGLVGPDSVARTLSARYYKDGSEILVETGGATPRRLTPRECARLMGYPEEYLIPVSDTQAYRQFGNSVVPPVVAFLAEHLVDRYISRVLAPAA